MHAIRLEEILATNRYNYNQTLRGGYVYVFSRCTHETEFLNKNSHSTTSIRPIYPFCTPCMNYNMFIACVLRGSFQKQVRTKMTDMVDKLYAKIMVKL